MALGDIINFLIGVGIVVIIACIIAAPILWIWSKFEKKKAMKKLSKEVIKEVEDEDIAEEIRKSKFKEFYNDIERERGKLKKDGDPLGTREDSRGSINHPGIEEESDERGRMEIPTTTLSNKHKKRVKLHHPTDVRPQSDPSK